MPQPTSTSTCLALPPFPAPPGLPSPLTIPIFAGFLLPALGLCCNIQIPPWGTFPIPAIALPLALPQAIVAAYMALIKAIQFLYDAVAIPCPSQ